MVKVTDHLDGGLPLNTQNLSLQHLSRGMTLDQASDNNIIARTPDGKVMVWIDPDDGALRCIIRASDVVGLAQLVQSLEDRVRSLEAYVAIMEANQT